MRIQNIGTRAQVWHGTAKKTSGGLTKSDLMQNKAGRIVSRAKHNTAKKEMRLVKYGYGTKKGEFGFVKLGSHKRGRKSMKRGSRKHGSRKMKGGSGMGNFSPADVNADYMIKDVVPQQFGPLERALVGGKSRRRSQHGGYHGNAFSPADAMAQGIDGQGITNYSAAGSVGVQEAAGMAGGRRRGRGRRRMQRQMQKGMMGGTYNRSHSPAGLGSANLQILAGRGN
jgi:hypothetical protein